MGCDVLLLTTIGRRSGTARTTPVGGFSDKDGTWLIVAAAGGTATNPAWYHNIAAHPDDVQIEVEGRTIAVTADQLHGAQRAQAWAQITATAPQFARFQQHTDRQLPVIRLTPRSGSRVVGATESPQSEGAVMNTTTRIRTDVGTRWKMHSFERFLEHHTARPPQVGCGEGSTVEPAAPLSR
jgi:deazaflavin-dependent oxidoreductase (nitroreductase family)